VSLSSLHAYPQSELTLGPLHIPREAEQAHPGLCGNYFLATRRRTHCHGSVAGITPVSLYTRGFTNGKDKAAQSGDYSFPVELLQKDISVRDPRRRLGLHKQSTSILRPQVSSFRYLKYCGN